VAALTAQDILDIRDIVSVWNIAEDEGDAERWAALFTEDGSSRYGNGRVEAGREALLEGALRRAVDPRMFPWSHWTLGEPTVDPTRDGAIMRHYYMTVNEAAPREWEIWSLTERVYRVRRVDGRWRIQERTIHNLPLGLASDADRARARAGENTVEEERDDDQAELTAADRLAIQGLITRYSVAEDTGDADETASLFIEDGTTVNGKGEVTAGRDAIREAAARRWEKPEVRTKAHWATNVLIESTSSGARARSYHMIIETDGGFRIAGLVAKHDTFRQMDGRWLFEERRVMPIGREARS
jgi:uncharacterized protein (TIGR02246 family)